MAASQVVLYFERQEDALRFTLAASSAISAEGTLLAHEAGAEMAKEICKVNRITTEGTVKTSPAAREDRPSPTRDRCA